MQLQLHLLATVTHNKMLRVGRNDAYVKNDYEHILQP